VTPCFTIHQAAKSLHKSERWLRGWLKINPWDALGRPFFALAGRTKLFTAADIDRMREAMTPEPMQCQSVSSRPVRARRPIGTDAVAISASLWIEAQKQLNDPSLGPSSINGKRPSKRRPARHF